MTFKVTLPVPAPEISKKTVWVPVADSVTDVDPFAWIETGLRDTGTTPAQSNLAEMDALWNEAKSLGF